MWPTVYVENDFVQDISPEEIFKIISEKNKEIIEKTESGQKLDSGDYKELAFNVGKLDINILENSYVNVYDIPGLNDARTKHIYYDYLETNFHKFNLVVFLVDIQSGLNTSDEMDMLKFIINNTQDQFVRNQRHIYTLVIVNKADDMQTEEDSDKLEITGELREMFEQVENTVKTEFANSGLKDNVIGVIPLCARDSYLYRMVKKHGNKFKLSPEQILKIGVNEMGKKFSMLKPAIQEARVNEILKDESFVNTITLWLFKVMEWLSFKSTINFSTKCLLHLALLTFVVFVSLGNGSHNTSNFNLGIHRASFHSHFYTIYKKLKYYFKFFYEKKGPTFPFSFLLIYK